MHREPDRVPLDIGGSRVSSIHLKTYQAFRRALGLPPSNPSYQSRYLQLPKVEEDFRSLLGLDIGSVDPLITAEERDIVPCPGGQTYTDRWGCEWFMPTGAAYFDIRKFPLIGAESIDDLKNYPWPKEDSPAILDIIAAEARSVWAEHGRAVILGRTCPGIFEMLSVMGGYEKALTDMALNPSYCEAFMDKILELKQTYYRAAIGRLLSAGVDYFIVSESDDLGAQRGLLMSADMYRRMIKPRHTRLFRAIKEYSGGRAFIELHSCGAIRELLPDMIESGVEILNPVQVNAAGMDDTRALKREFGRDLVFHGGGVDTQRTLVQGTPQQVRDEVKRRMEDLSAGGGFIFTPVHSIQHDVSFENFRAMLEAFRDYAG